MKILAIAVVGTILFLVGIVIVCVGGNWLLWRFRKRRSPSEQSLRKYRARLLNPKWQELEEHFRRPIPAQIKRLYVQKELIIRRNLTVRKAKGAAYDIAEFLPADIETLNETWREVKESRNFPFAQDSFGDCYYIPLDSDNSERCSVMCYHHDGSYVEPVSESLDEFLRRIEPEQE